MQFRNSISPMNIKGSENETASVFGGPLNIKGSVSKSFAGDAMKNEIAQKKLKKRLQLKNLIVTKFTNKYCISALYNEKLNLLIHEEIDKLFNLEHFDERDLVAVD